MSSLTQAGKSTLTNQVNRAFTKGLIGVDPQQLQRKEMQRRMYQEELKQQADEMKRRKAAEKERDRAEDEKLQRKIEMDIQREKEEAGKNTKQLKDPFGQNNANTNANNTKQNAGNTNQPSPTATRKAYQSQAQPNPTKNTFSSPQISLYKHPNLQPHEGYSSFTVNPPANQQPYSFAPRSIYNMQEQKYYQQEMENRARRFKETLDRKLEEVYRQIETSKKSYGGENVVEEIRRRLKSNSYNVREGEGFDGQRSAVKQFQDEFSMFYKIPKKPSDLVSRTNQTMKNLDYDSESRYKSPLKNYNYQQPSHLAQDNSRMYTERQSEYNEGNKWGKKRKNNFLGNREALDYKIESALSNIDNIIQDHHLQGGKDL